MANCCFCDFLIEFETEEEKKSFIKNFEEDLHKSNEENVGVFFGSDNRYLFESEIFDHNTTSVDISCWVKWCVDDDDMKDFIKYIKNNHGKTYNVKNVYVDYEEFSCEILGNYEYDGKKLTKNYLSEQQFREIYTESNYSKEEFADDEGAYEEYHDKLYAALANTPTVYVVPID